MTVCLPRPVSEFYFYRVAQGNASGTGPGPATNEVRLLSPLLRTDGGLDLRWNAVVGLQYRVQTATNIVPPPPVTWTTLATLTATTNLMTFKDPGPLTNFVQRFYRVVQP